MKLTNENISKIESRLGDLKDLVKKKPWFEAAHILLARKAIVEKSTQANDILFEASLHAGDRRILKQLIDLPKEAKPKKKPQVETKKKAAPAKKENQGRAKIEKITEPVKIEVKKTAKPIKASHPIKLESKPETNELVRIEMPAQPSKPREIILGEKKEKGKNKKKATKRQNKSYDPIEALAKKIDEPGQTTDFLYWLNDLDQQKIGSQVKHTNEEAIIEKFIKEQPKVRKPQKNKEYKLVNEKEQKGENQWVTETLAEVYIRQGLISKAIDIYKTLSLQNPSKKTYFANLIKKLKKQNV